MTDQLETKQKKTKKKKSRKLSKKGKIFFDILLIVALCVAVFSGYRLFIGLKQYQDGKSLYATIANDSEDTDTTNVSVSPIDWDYLRSINPDIAGWIKLNDSVVDYPFVYAVDNEYYLHHLFNGEYNSAGTVFVDYTNNRNLEDKVTVLYGHHMYNGTMFTDINNYKEQSYYDSHKVINIEVPEASYELRPIAGYTTTATDYYVKTSFSSDEEFMNYVNDFISKSQFTSDETVDASDKMILLSTCSWDIKDGRFALLGKLVKTKDYTTAEEKQIVDG